MRITYRTDSGVYPHELVARQLDTYVRFGMAPLAAIRSATVVAAECLGWADRVGTLRPGRFADLVAVDGDPLADVAVLEGRWSCIKGGRLALDRRGEVAGGGPAIAGRLTPMLLGIDHLVIAVRDVGRRRGRRSSGTSGSPSRAAGATRRWARTTGSRSWATRTSS